MANRYFVTLCSLLATIILLKAQVVPVLAKNACCSDATSTQTEHQITARVTYNLNSKSTAYTVNIDWDAVYGSDGYSVAISKVAGANPGPLTDTTTSKWSFTNVKAGTWYINLKSKSDGYWSGVSYWTVNLPKIAVTPTVATRNLKTNTVPTLKPVRPTEVIVWPTNTPAVARTGFSCNCSKTCTQIATCQEAYFQLNSCGCLVRDGDHDGVPCENLCGN